MFDLSSQTRRLSPIRLVQPRETRVWAELKHTIITLADTHTQTNTSIIALPDWVEMSEGTKRSEHYLFSVEKKLYPKQQVSSALFFSLNSNGNCSMQICINQIKMLQVELILAKLHSLFRMYSFFLSFKIIPRALIIKKDGTHLLIN